MSISLEGINPREIALVNTVALFATPVVALKHPTCTSGPHTLCIYDTALHVKPNAIVAESYKDAAQQSKDQRGVTLLLQVHPMPR